MTWDRFVVFSIALAFMGWANVAAKQLPAGRVRPRLSPEVDVRPELPAAASGGDTPPYLRELTPENRWVFDRAALAVDIAVASW